MDKNPQKLTSKLTKIVATISTQTDEEFMGILTCILMMSLVKLDGWVYLEMSKGMYGIQLTGILANTL
jgi:hypothetical protein